jgi:glycosyltransferase involved in cell wall biosynthesis
MQRRKIFWLSFLNFDFSNVVSQVEVSKHLAEHGNEVYLFAVRSRGGSLLPCRNLHLIFIPLRSVPIITATLYVLALLVLVPFYIVRNKPDYIITEKGSILTGVVLKSFFRPVNFKVILDVRSTPTESRSRFRDSLNALLFKFSVYLSRKLDGVTILTELMKKKTCSEFNIDPNFVGVWTSGASFALFNPREYDKEEAKAKLGLTGRFVILYHGAITENRGLAAAVEAIKILQDRYPNLVLFLLGGGPDKARLRKLAQQLDVQDNVTIHDMVSYERVPFYIAMCDVGIVPLPDSPIWRYQCPLKLLEYLSMEKVAIVTDIPANREVVGQCSCGVYIRSADPHEIARGISYALENQAKLEEWGKCGREIVEENYTWESVATKLEKYLMSR